MNKSQVVAKSDKDTFLLEADNEYTLVSLIDICEIDLGDFLKHEDWDAYDDNFVKTFNITTEEEIDLTIENWGMNIEQAAYHFQITGSPSRFSFLQGYSKRLQHHMDVNPLRFKEEL